MSQQQYLPTGNEMISIPTLRETDGAIMGISFLHMGFKGLIEINGSPETPFMRPYCLINNQLMQLEALSWQRQNYWIPAFTANLGSCTLHGTVVTPVGERGFIYSLVLRNAGTSEVDVRFGLKGFWRDTMHRINETKPVGGTKKAYQGRWFGNLVFDLVSTVNVFSFSTMCDDSTGVSHTFHQAQDSVDFNVEKGAVLRPGEEVTLNSFWGLAFEEIGAVTSAQEMTRKGFAAVYQHTLAWLAERVQPLEDEDLSFKLNLNKFFNYFFATGVTLDTEEFVLVTSRSPRYYVSAAYWDRDSLLWSFPSILLTDHAHAREMLGYVFTRQIRNVGTHSRYIDGTVLEPGFELDELCAPVIALYNYVKATNDRAFLTESHVDKGITRILALLQSKKHLECDLYETFLQPTDDMHVFPYLTYDNVLVWRLFRNLAELYHQIKSDSFVSEMRTLARRTERAIWDNCVVAYRESKIFAWSVDLKGGFNVYDEPPGSLQLLPFYDFCPEDNEVYRNTVAEIRREDYRFSFAGCPINEIGCEHAPHPWILSVANSLLCGRTEQARAVLAKTPMDNGIACESVHEHTGECTSGEAFASCAGFLSFALYKAFYEKKGDGNKP